MLFDVEREKDGNCSKKCSKCQSAYKQSMQIYLFNKLTKTKQKKKQSKLSEQREEILIFYI